MKKILLFADVGGHDDDEYYHVGDEAMLFETYRWYRQNHPDWQLSMLSWFPMHPSLEVVEKPHLHWAKKRSSLYFPILCTKLLCWKLTGISLFSPQEFELVQLIQEQDRVHFTGGGNLSTKFRQWMYYSFFVMLATRLSGKELILTSQTIGPISGVDRVFALFFFNLPQLIGIRAITDIKTEFKRYGAFLPKIKSMLDAAYALPLSISGLKKTTGKSVVIGLSVHAWEGWEKEGILLVQKVLKFLSDKYQLTIVLIPHHLVPKGKGTDIEYMQKIVSELPPKVEVFVPDIPELLSKEKVPATYIKKLTSQVDLLLTTRYHGIIFGLSKNVPTIALQFGEYYKLKNAGALEMFYGTEGERYQAAIKDPSAFERLSTMTTQILQNLTKEKFLLKEANITAEKSHHTLEKIMIEFETAQ